MLSNRDIVGGNGGSRKTSSLIPPWFDMYATPPSYQYPSYTSNVGIIMTAITVFSTIFYIGVTLKDYITVPPELIIQGTEALPKEPNKSTWKIPEKLAIGVDYRASEDSQNITSLHHSNTDPYFRFEFRHVTIQQQDKVPRIYQRLDVQTCDFDPTMICVNPDEAKLLRMQGRYISDMYQYIEIDVVRCKNDTATVSTHTFETIACAPDEEISKVIARQAKLRIHFLYEEFNPTHYHTHVRSAYYGAHAGQAVYTIPHDRRMFLLNEYMIKSEILTKGRSIYHERRHVGSPPFPERLTKIIGFDRFEDVIAPLDGSGDLAEFFIHLLEETTVEETMYWMPSVLDLFGAWGAVFAFFTQLSLGLFALTYNRWKYHQSFQKKTRELSILTEKSKRSKRSWTMVEVKARENVIAKIPDLRLFDRDHFDEHGRLCVTAEEFAHPTSLYGELRAYAINEHKKKVKAADLLLRTFRRRKFHTNVSKRASTIARTGMNKQPTLSAKEYEKLLKLTKVDEGNPAAPPLKERAL